MSSKVRHISKKAGWPGPRRLWCPVQHGQESVPLWYRIRTVWLLKSFSRQNLSKQRRENLESLSINLRSKALLQSLWRVRVITNSSWTYPSASFWSSFERAKKGSGHNSKCCPGSWRTETGTWTWPTSSAYWDSCWDSLSEILTWFNTWVL